MHCTGIHRVVDMSYPEPTERQVEAAAKAWMTWQFPGRAWEDAVPSMKDKFRDGARRALIAAIQQQ